MLTNSSLRVHSTCYLSCNWAMQTHAAGSFRTSTKWKKDKQEGRKERNSDLLFASLLRTPVPNRLFLPTGTIPIEREIRGAVWLFSYSEGICILLFDEKLSDTDPGLPPAWRKPQLTCSFTEGMLLLTASASRCLLFPDLMDFSPGKSPSPKKICCSKMS